ISKTGKTFQVFTSTHSGSKTNIQIGEGFAFSEDDLEMQVVKLLEKYSFSVKSRVDLVNSSNYFYNQLDYYRSIIIFEGNR
ncbi:MAG: hypothetical protein KAT65_16560, partial [Methanophagales archaeon]|nr:hypothetical protein [Methanophagales archaeon]